jgi:N-acetylglutamate synthase-like GNAT family acetyltransferase
MISIRTATRSDLRSIIDLLAGYFAESTYGLHVNEQVDADHATRLLFQVLHQGRIWLAYDDAELVGVLAVVREPNVWFPKKIALKEVAWYVTKAARTTSAGGRLFLAYEQWAQEQLSNGMVDAYFMTEMSTTSPIDFERRGFRLAERLYIKD